MSSVDTDAESAKIVHLVIQLAKSLRLPTIAEGIERLQTRNQIIDGGAEFGQGFYFGKAMPANEAIKLLGVAAEPGALRKA